MAGSKFGATSRHLEKIFTVGNLSGLADMELLDRFVSAGDGAAFEALVARHGPMVLATRRGVIPDADAVQDAFQAAFLVLVRKAATIRAGASLAGWPCRVARNAASQVNADAARRREMERRAAEMAGSSRRSDGAADDRVRTLYEEIDGLPEKYRLPVVLCHLEGMTHAEAAAQLRWTEGEVRGRVARAREVLRGRLGRRGQALSAGAIAVTLGERTAGAAAVPAAWVDAAVASATAVAAGRTAAGVVSAAAVTISNQIIMSMCMSNIKLMAAVLLAAGAATACAGTIAAPEAGPRGAAREDPSAAAVGRKAAADPGVDAVPILGRVVDPDGKPIPRAMPYVTHRRPGEPGRDGGPAATTGPDGSFRLDLDPAKSTIPTGDGPAWHKARIAAYAPGYGPAWADAGEVAKASAEFRLVRDMPIRGRVMDGEGRPVAGATVPAERIVEPRGLDPEARLATGSIGRDNVLVEHSRPGLTIPRLHPAGASSDPPRSTRARRRGARWRPSLGARGVGAVGRSDPFVATSLPAR